MGIFYREKTFYAGRKIRKNYFAPSEKYACYAPACTFFIQATPTKHPNSTFVSNFT